jgi:hypothetical protein
MNSEQELGSIAGLRISVQPSFFTARLSFIATLALLGRFIFKLSRPQALFGAIIAVVLDAFAVLIHQLGHAWMANRTGWPMTGIRFWGLFSTCTYPPEEPELPPEVHIQRAVGGPIISLLLGLVTGVPLLLLSPKKGLGRLLALFWVVNNIAVKFVLAFGPAPWTDGPPLRYWGKRLLAEREENRSLLDY